MIGRRIPSAPDGRQCIIVARFAHLGIAHIGFELAGPALAGLFVAPAVAVALSWPLAFFVLLTGFLRLGFFGVIRRRLVLELPAQEPEGALGFAALLTSASGAVFWPAASISSRTPLTPGGTY